MDVGPGPKKRMGRHSSPIGRVGVLLGTVLFQLAEHDGGIFPNILGRSEPEVSQVAVETDDISPATEEKR
jgi:hypothetical protein